MILFKTLLQEIIVKPRWRLHTVDMYKARLNQDITWHTQEGPYDLPVGYYIHVFKLNNNMYYLANALGAPVHEDEVFILPARYLEDISRIDELYPELRFQVFHDEVLDTINSTLDKKEPIIAKPGKS
jgi:hypothetical protein